MAWTYTGNPENVPVDRVRFMCGDTNADDPLLSDTEIQFLIAARDTPERAAQDACVMIMAKLAREVDYTIGPEQVKASQRLTNYRHLMNTLRRTWSNSLAVPSWESYPPNGPTTLFDVGMHDNGGGRRGPTT